MKKAFVVEVIYEPHQGLPTPRYILDLYANQEDAKRAARNFNRRISNKNRKEEKHAIHVIDNRRAHVIPKPIWSRKQVQSWKEAS